MKYIEGDWQWNQSHSLLSLTSKTGWDVSLHGLVIVLAQNKRKNGISAWANWRHILWHSALADTLWYSVMLYHHKCGITQPVLYLMKGKRRKCPSFHPIPVIKGCWKHYPMIMFKIGFLHLCKTDFSVWIQCIDWCSTSPIIKKLNQYIS